jgi:AraC-like DNA-binding protein
VGVTVLPVATRALVAACARLGLDTDALLARAGVDRGLLDDPDARVPAERADAVWREAYGAATDPALSLHAAEQTPFGAFRVLDYLGASGATVGEGLRRVAAYFPLVDPRAALEVEEEEGAVAIVFRGVGMALPPQAQEYTLAILASRVRHVAPAAEVAVRLAFPRPAEAREHARVLGVEPAFGAAAAALAIPRAAWDAPTRTGDRSLFAALDEHARALLARASPGAGEAARVRAAIAADLPGKEPSLARVARRLGTSARTLQRRLGTEGTTFAAAVDEVRRERARAYLGAPDVSMAEVSWLLGFGEQSAFGRAFRRWTGETPTRWRRERAKASGPRRPAR